MPKEPGNLYVKYADGDDGTDVIPAGAAFWASPSIWLTDTAGNSIPSAQVGVDNWVHVRVDSTSTEPYTGVKVQTWVCDYTAGFIGPDAAQSSSGGANGRTATVGTAVTKSSPGTMHVVWRPTNADLINGPNPREGHLCVGANVYVESPPGPEGARLTGGRLDVINNRHHGWKNVTVITKTLRLAPFAFRLANPGAEPDEFRVRARELDRGECLGRLEREHLLMRDFVDLVDGEPRPDPVPALCQTEPLERTWLAQGGRLVLRNMPEPAELRPAEHDAEFTIRTVNPACEEREQCGDPTRVRIRPGELTPVVFVLECDGDPGEVHTIDITQRTGEGAVIGGARLIAVHVPDWHCR
ncbi:hypothetical protein [Bailinhaonella thermotolerans]|uniref:Uncharacterized protein n=1 Tax=Bailinhaonella thermotolerans TaxID=1070861 RepID=A0A3A4BBG8_9ACTN|nr:hypothetical protein [Bailinhaonella thermotolerans]RJL35446.1 hypothetical protein D5H75_01120 [Bailinhaonella thermotolerans]